MTPVDPILERRYNFDPRFRWLVDTMFASMMRKDLTVDDIHNALTVVAVKMEKEAQRATND